VTAIVRRREDDKFQVVGSAEDAGTVSQALILLGYEVRDGDGKEIFPTREILEHLNLLRAKHGQPALGGPVQDDSDPVITLR